MVLPAMNNRREPSETSAMRVELDHGARCPPSQPTTFEALLTVAEASRVFNLKAHVLRKAVKTGAIPAYSLANRRIRLRASDINAAIEASRRVGGR
jgi:excisionase family DNA binding protein